MNEIGKLTKVNKSASSYSVHDFIMFLGASLNQDGFYISPQQLEDALNKALALPQCKGKDPNSLSCAFAMYADFVSILGQMLGFLNVKDNDEAWLSGLPLSKGYLTSFKIAVVEALFCSSTDQQFDDFTVNDVVEYMQQHKVDEKAAIIALRRKAIKIIH